MSSSTKTEKPTRAQAPNKDTSDPREAFHQERDHTEQELSPVALNLYSKLSSPDQYPNRMINRLAPINRNSPGAKVTPLSREKASQLVYVMAKDAIERKDQAILNQLGVKDCFFQLTRTQAFALCILCLEQAHENAFKKIIRAFPELATWQPSEGPTHGMSLIHLAARLNREEIIQYLLTKDKSSGETKDLQGDTFLHTAVRYNAHKVIDRVMALRTILFSQMNNKGLRPGDLPEPGAAYIRELTHNLYLQAVLRNAQARASKIRPGTRRPTTGQFQFIPKKD